MKLKSKSKRKNYIVLGIIYLVVIVAVLYLASWYNTYKNYREEIPILQNVLLEVKPDELDHFLMENPSSILYLCKANDSDCRDFESSLKTALQNNDYQDIVYVNLMGTDDTTNYLKELLEKYNSSDYTIERTPCLIKFTDGKVTDIEDGLNGAVMTKDEALNFIDVNSETGL